MPDYTRKQLDVNGSYIFPYTHADSVLYTTVNAFNGITSGTDTNVKAVLDALDNTYRRQDSNITSLYNSQGKRGFLYQNGTTTTASMELPTQGDTFYFPKLKYDSNGNITTSWETAAGIVGNHYIGTTATQSTSTSQALTGITSIDALAYFDTTNSRVGIGTSSPSQKLTVSGDILTTGKLYVGTGGTNSYITSDTANNIYLRNSAGAIVVCDSKVVRRGANLGDVTLGNSTYPWGGVYTTTLNIVNGSAASHINFSRASYNYLNVPTNGSIAFSINGAALANTILIASNTALTPGQTNKSIDLGSSSYYWNNLYANTVYENGTTLANKYLALTGGTLTGALNVSTSGNATDTTKGINFTQGSTTGHIGLSTLLGIYSNGDIVIRPGGGNTAGQGLDITTNSFKFNNKNVSLEGHNHDDRYVTDVGLTDDVANHPNQLVSIKNGVKSYFTVPYATEASKLKVLQTKTYEGILRVNATYSSPYAASYLYFGSVKTTDLTKPSHVKYKVLAYAPSNANFQLESVVEWYFGNNGIYKGSYIWNNLSSTSYYPFGYHTLYYAKTAAIAQSDGSYLGCYYGSSASYGQSANTVARTIKIEVTECNNCTVDLLDDPVWLHNASSVPANFRQPSTSKAYNDANFTATNVSTAVGLQETGDANTNTIGYQLRTNSYSKPMTSAMGYGYRLLFTSADKLGWVPANNSTSSNATAVRTPATDLIDPFGEIVYYSGTAAVAAGSRPSATSLWQQYTITLGYSFNTTGAALTLTSWKPVYIKCRPELDDSAEIIGYTQDLPTSEDGFIYIYLGVAYSATAVEILMNHPVYYYKDGAVRIWPGGTDMHDYSSDYLTFKALSDGTITFAGIPTVEYSLDGGDTWVSSGSEDSSVYTLEVTKGDVIKWKGEVTEEFSPSQGLGVGQFGGSATFEAYGNLNSLLYGDSFVGKHVIPYAFMGYGPYDSRTEVPDMYNTPDGYDQEDAYGSYEYGDLGEEWYYVFGFYGLFAQSKIVKAGNLVLDTVLQEGCYTGLFQECTLLEEAPKFSPTTVAPYSCMCMFYKCTSLKTFDSSLTAEVLEESCYTQMFMECTSLSKVPEILATTLAPYCCQAMYQGCKSLEDTGAFPQATLAESCFEGMFRESGIKHAQILGYSTLQPACFKNMFRSCENLEQYDGISATTFAEECCMNMFRGCHNLQSAHILPPGWDENGSEGVTYSLDVSCFANMFNDCAKIDSFEFPLLNVATPADSCYLGMFKNCREMYQFPTLTINTTAPSCCESMFEGCGAGSFYSNYSLPIYLNATDLSNYCYFRMFAKTTFISYHLPALPATTLAPYCYSEMFLGCSKLTETPSLPATTLADGCYAGMFSLCTSLNSVPTLACTTVYHGCYENMFQGCTALTITPTLPATSLNSDCYKEMFKGCTSLVNPPQLSATSLSTSCYQGMFENCTSLTSMPVLPATTASSSCYKHMFAGCSSLKVTQPLVATSVNSSCYEAMFQNCTALVTAPEILATSYNSYAFRYMFKGCTALETVPNLGTQTAANYDSHDEMFMNCSSLRFIRTSLKTITKTSMYGRSYSPINDWLTGVSPTGIYVAPNDVTYTKAYAEIPEGWEFLTESQYTQYQQQHKNDGKPVFIVEVTAAGSTTYTADKTSEQVYNAFQDGYPIELRYSSSGIDSVAYVYEVNYDSNNDIYTIYYISILPSMGLDSHHEFEFQHQGTTVTGYYKQLVTTTQVTSYIESAVGTSIVNHGTSDTSFSLTPNVFHKWGSVVSLNLLLATPSNTDIVNEYMFEFTSPSTPTNLTLPNTVRWVALPSIEANKTYQVSIVNNLAVIGGA